MSCALINPRKRAHKHHGIQSYCVLFKKAGMPEQTYMPHSSDYFTDVRTNRTIKDVMGGSVVNSTDTVKWYKKSENKKRRIWKLWGSITKFSIELPINPSCAVKSRRSRRSGKKLLRRVSTLPLMIRNLIPCYLEILAEILTGSLLGVRRWIG